MIKAIAITLLLASVAGAGKYETLHHARRGRVTDAWAAAGLNEGLVSYWAMRTNTATTVYDEWGTNTATAVNSPTFSEANGVRDDGVGMVAASLTAVLPGLVINGWTNLTIASWVKISSYGSGNSTWPAFWGASVSGNTFNMIARYNAGSPELIFESTKDGNTVFRSASSILLNTWTHVVMTRGDDGNKLYRNGELVGTDSTILSTVQVGRTLAVGYSGFPNYRYMTGSQDEVAVWNRALSSNEVYQIYNTPLYAPYKQ
jgi:hypothetical protein